MVEDYGDIMGGTLEKMKKAGCPNLCVEEMKTKHLEAFQKNAVFAVFLKEAPLQSQGLEVTLITLEKQLREYHKNLLNNDLVNLMNTKFQM